MYRASKAALNSVLKDISLAAKKSTCIAFHPGWVKTAMGGEGAEIDVQESVAGMRAILASLARSDNGKFVDYTGAEIAW